MKKLLTTAGYWNFDTEPTTELVDEIVKNAEGTMSFRDYTGLWINARGMKSFIEANQVDGPGRYFVRTGKKNWRHVSYTIQKVS